MLLKSAIGLLIVTALAFIFQAQVIYALNFLLLANNKVAHGLGTIFSNGPVGRIILETITSVLIPAIVVAIIAAGWFLVRRKQMPHIVATAWIVWTILIVMILSQPIVHHAA